MTDIYRLLEYICRRMTARKQISLVMMLLLFYQLNQVMLLHQHTDLQRSVLDAHIPA